MSDLKLAVSMAISDISLSNDSEAKESFSLAPFWQYMKNNQGKLGYTCLDCGTINEVISKVSKNPEDMCLGDVYPEDMYADEECESISYSYTCGCGKYMDVYPGSFKNTITFIALKVKDHLIKFSFYVKRQSKDIRKDGNEYLKSISSKTKYTFNMLTNKLYVNEFVGHGWQIKQYTRVDLDERLSMLSEYVNHDHLSVYYDKFNSLIRENLNKTVSYYGKMDEFHQNNLVFSRNPIYEAILNPMIMGETMPIKLHTPREMYLLYKKLLKCDTTRVAKAVWERHYNIVIGKKVFKWSVNDVEAFKSFIVLTRYFNEDKAIGIVMENKIINRNILISIADNFYHTGRETGVGNCFIDAVGVNKVARVAAMGDIGVINDSIRMYDRLSEMFDGYALRSNSFEEVHQDLSDDLGIVTQYGAAKKTKYTPEMRDNTVKCFSTEIDGITVSPLLFGGEFFDVGNMWGNCVGSYNNTVEYRSETLVASYDENGKPYLIIEIRLDWNKFFKTADIERVGRERTDRQRLTDKDREFVKKYLKFLNLEFKRSRILVDVGDLEELEADKPVLLPEILNDDEEGVDDMILFADALGRVVRR